MNHRKINHLLNTELSAVETYEQALEKKEWKVLGPDPQIQALFHILVDHVQAASQLAAEVQRLGGRPVNGTKLFGDANPFRDKAALETLKEGEESGLKEYQTVLHHQALSPEVKPLIRSLKTKQQAHVRALDDLMIGCNQREVRHDHRHTCYPDKSMCRVAAPTHAQKGKCRQVLGQPGPDRGSDR